MDVKSSGSACVPMRGFSLIEVVVTMAVITTVAGIGLVKYSHALSRYRVQSACARVTADLRAAAVAARTTSSSRTIIFNQSAATYRVLTAAEVAASAQGALVSLASDPYRATMRVDGLPGYQLTFNGRGEGNGGAIVVLRCADVESAVIVETTSGRVYVAGSTN